MAEPIRLDMRYTVLLQNYEGEYTTTEVQANSPQEALTLAIEKEGGPTKGRQVVAAWAFLSGEYATKWAINPN